MRFSDADLVLLGETDEIRIETTNPDGGTHRTIIWVMVEAGDVFVRSVNGSGARWYREAVSDPAVVIHVDGRALPATATASGDPDSVRRTGEVLARKYDSRDGLEPMLKPEIFDTTLRLTPR